MNWKNQLYYGDNLRSRDVRDLVGVLDREKAVIGIFVTLQPPTKDMLKEAVSAGYPRMNAATFKRAARQRRTQGEQDALF